MGGELDPKDNIGGLRMKDNRFVGIGSTHKGFL